MRWVLIFALMIIGAMQAPAQDGYYAPNHYRMGATLTVGASRAKYTTLSSALAAAVSGDVVLVTPGTYTLTAGITVPAGVALVGLGGWPVTKIVASGTPGNMVTIGNNCTLRGLSITSATGINQIAVKHAGTSDTEVSVIDNCKLHGDYDTVSADSPGELLVTNCYLTAGFDVFNTANGKTTIQNCYCVTTLTYDSASRSFVVVRVGVASARNPILRMVNNYVELSASDKSGGETSFLRAGILTASRTITVNSIGNYVSVTQAGANQPAVGFLTLTSQAGATINSIDDALFLTGGSAQYHISKANVAATFRMIRGVCNVPGTIGGTTGAGTSTFGHFTDTAGTQSNFGMALAGQQTAVPAVAADLQTALINLGLITAP